MAPAPQVGQSRILGDSDTVKLRTQRVVDQQRAVEAVAEAEQLLQHLDRRNVPSPGDCARIPASSQRRHQIGRRPARGTGNGSRDGRGRDMGRKLDS